MPYVSDLMRWLVHRIIIRPVALPVPERLLLAVARHRTTIRDISGRLLSNQLIRAIPTPLFPRLLWQCAVRAPALRQYSRLPTNAGTGRNAERLCPLAGAVFSLDACIPWAKDWLPT